MHDNRGNEDDLRGRLASAWSNGKIAEACGILIDEVGRQCVRWLLSCYRPQLSEEDAEDCFEHGVEMLLRHRGDSNDIADPFNYVFKCARNEALDILKEQQYVVSVDPEWVEGETGQSGEGVDLPPNSARWLSEAESVIVETALDAEISVRNGHLRRILQAAMLRLTPKRRTVVETLLERDPTISNAVLAELLGQPETTIRSLKKRALDDLRRELPLVAEELGVDLERLLAAEPEVIVHRPDLPTPEDDAE